MTAPNRHAEVRAIVRFALVGLANTAFYLALCWTMEGLTALPSPVINTVAMTLGLLASYAGHSRLTYRGSMAHRRGGPRFVAATAAIFLSAAAVQWTVHRAGVADGLTYLVVAVWYPVASFLAHHFWTFRRGRIEG